MLKFKLSLLVIGIAGMTLAHAQDTNATPVAPTSTNAASAPVTPAPATAASSDNDNQPTVQKALDFYKQGKSDEALAIMNSIIKSNPKDLNSMIFRGAIYAQKQDWDNAEKDYQTALQMDPSNDGIRFDLADLKFREKKFDDARAAFVPIQNNRDDDVSDLIKYKIYLCDLLMGRDDVAAKELQEFDQAGAKASYYFGNAAWALVHKKPEEARKWLESAATIFSPTKHLRYVSILKDMGYLPLPPKP